MKTMKKYVYALMGAAMMMSIASCSQDVNALDGIEEVAVAADDEVMVTFEMGGEITSGESALTRAEGSTDDLYGVQIDKDGSHYAYGLFDDVSKIQLAMSKNSRYNIIVSLVKNGRNLIFHSSSNYCYPFYTFGNTSEYNYTTLNNSFQISSYLNLDAIGRGYSDLHPNHDYYYYPAVDRFYGELNDFTPTENCTVTIPMKRTAFGLRYQVSGITDGTVSVKINKAWEENSSNKNEVFFSKNDIADTYTSEDKIITFKDVKDAWQYADNYTDEVTVSIQWTRGVGIVEDLGTKTIKVKRNRMNVVNINLSANDGSAGIGVVLDDINLSKASANIHVE